MATTRWDTKAHYVNLGVSLEGKEIVEAEMNIWKILALL
jgi:hypothetical protein